jgi:hypothetical protein
MQQSDYILREIEKIGAMIMGMIGKMRRRKEEGEQSNEDEFSEWKVELRENASLDLDVLLHTELQDFATFFERQKGYNEANTELIADLLVQIAKNPIGYDARELKMKALEIYQYLDTSSKTYSFERVNKIKQLKNSIDLK